MALANPPTTPNGSKVFAGHYDNTGANAQAVIRAIKTVTVNSEVMAHLGIATHAEDANWAAGDPIVVIGGVEGTDIVPLPIETVAAAIGTKGLPVMGSDGTNARFLSTNASGHVNIADGGNSITVDGSVSINGSVTVSTHAVTQSGTWNVGLSAGTNNIGDVDILSIAAGANVIGGVRDAGWDNAAAPPNRGLAQSVTATMEQTLLSADASNLYNITDVLVTWFSGSTAPAAMRTIVLRLGTSGGGDPIFHTIYIPATSQQTGVIPIRFREPVRSATNKAITCQLSGALGTGGEYSVMVLAYKTAS